MRGSIRHRGDERAGSWEYIVDIGMAASAALPDCNRRFWVERRPKESCPACGGELMRPTSAAARPRPVSPPRRNARRP